MNSARAYAGPLRESRLLIALASLLVPRAHRAEWRAEWNAEMWHAWHLLRERGQAPRAAHGQLLRWTMGAFAGILSGRAGDDGAAGSGAERAAAHHALACRPARIRGPERSGHCIGRRRFAG